MIEIGVIVGKKGIHDLLLINGSIMTFEKEKNQFAILRTKIEDLDLVDEDLEREVRETLLDVFANSPHGDDDVYIMLFTNTINESGSRKCYYASLEDGILEVWINIKDRTVIRKKFDLTDEINALLTVVVAFVTKGATKYFKSAKHALQYMNKKVV